MKYPCGSYELVDGPACWRHIADGAVFDFNKQVSAGIAVKIGTVRGRARSGGLGQQVARPRSSGQGAVQPQRDFFQPTADRRGIDAIADIIQMGQVLIVKHGARGRGVVAQINPDQVAAACIVKAATGQVDGQVAAQRDRRDAERARKQRRGIQILRVGKQLQLEQGGRVVHVITVGVMIGGSRTPGVHRQIIVTTDRDIGEGTDKHGAGAASIQPDFVKDTGIPRTDEQTIMGGQGQVAGGGIN